jgi:hypothetical protein
VAYQREYMRGWRKAKKVTADAIRKAKAKVAP